MRSTLALLLSMGLLLSGCSLFGPREAVEGPGDPAAWQLHREQITRLDAWQLNGKVGIKSPQESGSGTLFWLQRQEYFDLRLSGPLGRGAARLTGRPGAVLLEIAGEGRFEAASPEALLEARMGWRLPVTHLYWWVRGLPAPDRQSRLALNSAGQLAELEQDGWHVEFSAYALHDGHMLPERIRLEGQSLQVTLVIKEWQPRPRVHP